jgi:hypothetical protein
MQRAAGQTSINNSAVDVSPDGRTLLYCNVGSSGSSEIWLFAPGDQKPVKLLHSDSTIMHASFAPSGRFIAYATDKSGTMEVMLETFPISDRKWLVSSGGGYEPRWRSDGGEIYYLSPDRKLMVIPIGSDGPTGVPKALFQTKVAAGINGFRRHFVPSRDGHRFLINTLTEDPTPNPITVVVNWTSALKH